MKKTVFLRNTLLVAGALAAAFLLYRTMPFVLRMTLSLEDFRQFILASGRMGGVLFFLFQVLQTVVAPIPGEVIQVAGGYIYGLPFGLLLTTGGMLAGAMIAFWFPRLLGRRLIEKLLQRPQLLWMKNLTESNKFTLLLFVIFLIPGLPKDFLIYVAGLTPIRASRFFAILLVSRLPWLYASVSIGASIHHQNYASAIVVAAIAVVAFAIGIARKDRILSRFAEKSVTGKAGVSHAPETIV